MQKIFVHAFKIFMVGFLGAHLLVHVLYLAPHNPATSTYSGVVDSYMQSFFAQNWHLFAPEPALSSLKLSYRCHSLQDWQFPLDSMFKEHKAFPITATGKQTYVLQHLTREIFNSRLLKNDSAKQELHILQRYLQDQCGERAAAEVRIQRVYTQDYSKRFSHSDKKTETFTFGIKQESFAWN